MSDLDRVLARIDADLDASLDRLFELLRIPSVSTDPAFNDPCREAAEWSARALREIGLDAEVRPTEGKPMVIGHTPPEAANGGLHALFYGHYDVQPADPLELWDAPPFEPHLEGEGEARRIVARGACDDKGQFMTFLEASRAWVAEHGRLPLTLSVLLEGEEECGSPSLPGFLAAHGEELKADLALVCDTGMWDAATPAISTRLRGLLAEEIVVFGPKRDVHSGAYGGAAWNPIHVLARIVADVHDADGRVAVPGFYEGVEELPAALRRQWEGLGFDGAAFLADIGLNGPPAGERDRSVLEKVWSRPTVEANGIVGGYVGAGTKTIIPAKASVKITCRLVGRQDPAAIRQALRAFAAERVPEGCRIEFLGGPGAPAFEMPTDSEAFRLATAALEEEWGKAAALIGCGGSIPIVESFKSKLGMDSLLVGFALDDDGVHSPNEKYDLKSFHKGMRSWARIIAALGDGG